MGLSSYNGYSGEVRERAGHWQKGAYLMGLRPRPIRCAACGCGVGVIVGHWETYDEPFHLNDDIPLCSICHLWVHCRHRCPAGFDKYANAVAQGYTAANPMLRFDWAGFEREWLKGDEWHWRIPAVNGDPQLLFRIASGEELNRLRALRKM